jgi:hypothetical protein
MVSFVVKGLMPPKDKPAQEETEKQNENFLLKISCLSRRGWRPEDHGFR